MKQRGWTRRCKPTAHCKHWTFAVWQHSATRLHALKSGHNSTLAVTVLAFILDFGAWEASRNFFFKALEPRYIGHLHECPERFSRGKFSVEKGSKFLWPTNLHKSTLFGGLFFWQFWFYLNPNFPASQLEPWWSLSDTAFELPKRSVLGGILL